MTPKRRKEIESAIRFALSTGATPQLRDLTDALYASVAVLSIDSEKVIKRMVRNGDLETFGWGGGPTFYKLPEEEVANG